MQRLEVSGAVRPIYVSLGVKRLKLATYVWKCMSRQVLVCCHLSVWPQCSRAVVDSAASGIGTEED